jgi:DNA polymerase
MQFGLFEDRPKYFASLDDLVETMMKMEDDPLFPEGTNMVIYRGNPEAKLMIVGEAPGTEEDRLGKPFVGRSGQLLDQILKAADFDPEKDVFITNAVFRLPPGDGGKPLRKPTSDEIAFYKPYLLEIIRLIDPRIILLTGNVSTESILDKVGITQLRGQCRAASRVGDP